MTLLPARGIEKNFPLRIFFCFISYNSYRHEPLNSSHLCRH